MHLSKLIAAALTLASVHGDTCTLTGSSPRTNRVPLVFCSMFMQNTCCDPAIDAQIAEYYNDMIGVSDLCASRTSKARTALKYLFCFGCHPKQFLYTDEDAESLTLCQNIVEDVDPLAFDDCGLLVPGERGNICAGDDVVVPSLAYPGNSSLDRALEFLNDENAGAIPYFEGWEIKVCEEGDPTCSDQCYRISAGISFKGTTSSILLGSIFLLSLIIQCISFQ